MTTDQALLRAFGFTEELISSNGHHVLEAQCFGCGALVDEKHHVPGNRAWCPECRAAGKPNAQRQKEFRAKRRESK